MMEHTEMYDAPFEKVLAATWVPPDQDTSFTHVVVTPSDEGQVVVQRQIHTKVSLPFGLSLLLPNPIELVLQEETHVDLKKKTSTTKVHMIQSNTKVTSYLEVEHHTTVSEEGGKTKYVASLEVKHSSLPEVFSSFMLKQWLSCVKRLRIQDNLPLLPIPSVM